MPSAYHQGLRISGSGQSKTLLSLASEPHRGSALWFNCEGTTAGTPATVVGCSTIPFKKCDVAFLAQPGTPHFL